MIFYFVNIHVDSLSWIIQNLNWFPGFGNVINHPCDLSQNGINTSNMAKYISKLKNYSPFIKYFVQF